MTTYELPQEPPIGESVRDAFGRTWKHEGVNLWTLKNVDTDGPDTRIVAPSQARGLKRCCCRHCGNDRWSRLHRRVG